MASKPTANEAAAALREVSDRHQQAVYEDATPRWLLAVMFGLLLIAGVVTDLQPSLGSPLTTGLAVVALLLTFATRSKRIGSRLGYRRSPSGRPVRAPRGIKLWHTAMLVVIIVALLALGRLLRDWQVPYPTTLCYVVAGGLVLLAHGVLARVARRRQAVDHG